MVNMATLNNTHIPATNRHAHSPVHAGLKPVCPRCGSSVFRITRRPLDRLLSLVAPVQRYKCRAEKANFDCMWEGVIPLKNLDEEHAADHQSGSRKTVVTQSRASKDKVPALRKNPEAFVDMSFDDMAQITLDAIGDAVLVVNPGGEVIYLNKVAESMTGWSRKLAIGRTVEEIFPIIDGDSRQRRVPPSQRAINEDKIVELALGSVLIRHDGTGIAIEDSAAPIRNHQGKVAGAVIVFHDAAISRVEIQKMSHLAQHDPLTGLPNRALLAERLSQAIGMAKRHCKLLAVLFVDLDHFKQVNDTLGHETGDLLLQDVAENILACVRATDTVCRHGGDEFVILLPQIEDIEDPTRIAEKLQARFARPRTIAGHQLEVSLSIGISVYPDDGMDSDALMRHADAAMYASKAYNRKLSKSVRHR